MKDVIRASAAAGWSIGTCNEQGSESVRQLQAASDHVSGIFHDEKGKRAFALDDAGIDAVGDPG